MLRQSQQTLNFITVGEGLLNITAELNRALISSGMQQGQACLLCLHTSCSLTINENSDARVLADLSAHLQALVPEEGFKPLSGRGPLRPYLHDDEGADDMPAHIRTSLTSSNLCLPFQSGRLLLGTWQAIYLWEHRSRPQRRQLNLQLIGE
jgi:secondary thiamine-phosphate synthase enzyme